MPAGRFPVNRNPLKGLVSKPPKTYQQYLKRRRKRGLVGAVMPEKDFEERSRSRPRATGGRDRGPTFLGLQIYADEQLQRRRRKKR